MTTQAFPADSAKDYLGTALDASTSTMTVLMKTNKYYTDNTLKQTGQRYTVTREWGKVAVEKGWASDVSGVLPEGPIPAGFTTAVSTAVRALVAGGWSAPAILLGDSRTAQTFATVTADFVSGVVMKWAGLGNAALGSPFRLINGGVSGDTTAQMLVRTPTLLAANPGPGWLIIRGGVNDLQSGNLVASNATSSQVTKEMIVANFSAIVELGVAAGKKIGFCTEVGSITPFAAPIDANTAYGALQREALGYVNSWIRAICVTNGYRLLDFERAHNDPATGIPPTNHYVSDGVHLSYIGSCVEARAFVETFSDLATPPRSPFARFDPANLLGPVAGGAGAVTATVANETLIVTPATAAGGIPVGWSISRFNGASLSTIGAGSKVARTDYVQGTVAQMAFTSAESFGGAGFWIGGDATNVLGRWDRSWTLGPGSGGACGVGRRVDANGRSYVCVDDGTLAVGADPTAAWSTQPGAFITDGTAIFLCQRKPLAGETVRFTIEVEFDTLVGNMTPICFGYFRDTAGLNEVVVYGQPDITGASGIAGNWLPPRAVFSCDLLLPNSNIRYLAIQVGLYGENASTCNMRVLSTACENLDA